MLLSLVYLSPFVRSAADFQGDQIWQIFANLGNFSRPLTTS